MESFEARLGFVEEELVRDKLPVEEVVEIALDARLDGAGLGGAGRLDVGVIGEPSVADGEEVALMEMREGLGVGVDGVGVDGVSRSEGRWIVVCCSSTLP